MDPNQWSGRKGRAISEAVGFILILAAVIVALSLYLVYLMPAMGREGEIATMNEVKERLAEYKIDIDTLWTSRQCSTAYGPAISMGSRNSGGILSFLPGMLKPPNADPTLGLNQRDEYISITSDSYYPATSAGYNVTGPLSTSPVNINVNRVPRNFYITLSPDDLTLQKGVRLQGPTWSAWVNITPSYKNVSRFSMDVTSDGFVNGWTQWYEELLDRTDVTVSILKGQSPIFTDLVVYQQVKVSGVYQVDLMNQAYGVSSELQYPQTVQAWTTNTTVNASYWAYYGTVPKVTEVNVSMGSLEFHSNNYFYVPQTYYYQLGGVFLEQQDGAIVEVPPSISLSYVNGSPMVKVGKILLWGSRQATNMSGTAPITMATAVTDIVDTPLAPGANTRWVNLSITAANANVAQMWNRTFREIADRGGLPTTIYTTGASGKTAFILITGNPQLYDIQLSVTQVNVSGDYQQDNPPGGITRSWRSLQSYRALPPPITWTPVPTTPAVPPPVAPPTSSAAWPCGGGFSYRINITINKTAINGPLTNFPALINLTNVPGLAHAQSNGWDINFTDSTGVNPIPYERQSFTIHGSSGDLVAWVKVPSLTTTANTTIYMYYGKSVSSDQQNPTAVWDSNYKGVWHLEESGSGLAGEFRDSTSNSNHGQGGSGAGANTPTRTGSGKIGYGQSFDGADWINVANNATLQPTTAITISGWINLSSFGSGTEVDPVLRKGEDQPNNYQLKADDRYATLNLDGYDDDPRIGSTYLSTYTWYYFAGTWQSGSLRTVYLNGGPDGTGSFTGPIGTDNRPVYLGGRSGGEDRITGKLDEVRISDISRSGDWIKTEYANQNSPTTFAYAASEEPANGC
jgi:hypothetical protein